MVMKIIISVLGLLNGSYMLLDGIFVMIYGKYIGPYKPGPWANLFYKLDIDVFKLGPLFIAFGIAWLFFLLSFWTKQKWSYIFGILLSVLTLWYLPIGTLFSITIIILLLIVKRKVGMGNLI